MSGTKSEAVTGTLPSRWQPYAKAVVAVLGLVGVVLGLALQVGGILPAGWLPYVHVTLGVLTFYGVYQVPNRRPA